MPDIPPEVRAAAYAARHGEPTDTYTWDYVADAVLNAAARLMAAAVARAIDRHRDAHGRYSDSFRRHLTTAAQVAAGAFTTRQELLDQVAAALEAGNFIACDLPEEPL